MTRKEWLEWRSLPQTKAFLTTCADRIGEAKEILSVSAGLDQNQDNFYRGFIAAYNEMLTFTVEDTEEEFTE